MFLSKRIANQLFGKHNGVNGKQYIENDLVHTIYGRFTWRGDDGIIPTFFKRIQELESKVAALEAKKK